MQLVNSFRRGRYAVLGHFLVKRLVKLSTARRRSRAMLSDHRVEKSALALNRVTKGLRTAWNLDRRIDVALDGFLQESVLYGFLLDGFLDVIDSWAHDWFLILPKLAVD